MDKTAHTPSSPPVAPPPSALRSFDVTDLKQYLHIIVKRIWLVALCFVVSLSVMVVLMTRQVPVYRARATLLLSRGLPLPYSMRQQEVEPLGDYVGTQQLIIQSELLVSRARDRLNVSSGESGKAVSRLAVYPVGKTALLAIEVDSLDPVFGADFANALAEEYLDFKVEERMNTSQATVVSLTQQANKLHEELKKAEERTVAFEKENSVVAIKERGNIAASYLAGLSSQAARYRTERMLLEAEQPLLSGASDEVVLAALSPGLPSRFGSSEWSVAALGGSDTNAESVVEYSAEQLIARGVVTPRSWDVLKRTKSILESQLAQYRKKFRDRHPVVQKTLKALEDTQRELDVELQFALRQYYSALEALAIKEQAVRRAEKEWEDDALEASRKSQEYRTLQRNVDRLQSLYDLIFNRLKEIDISLGIEPESIRLMERAQPATNPITPRKLESIFLAALIGLGLGLVIVFALEYIDDSVRFPEDITRHIGIPFFGVVPAADWDPEDLHSHMLSNFDQKSGLSEAYRNIRSALLFSGVEDRIKAIAMTSAVPREGKTTTCLNLAVSLAQAGSRVLIVDADLRRGEMHKYFGLEGGRGLSDILVGQAKPEAVIQRTGIPNLDLIATGPFPPNPAELALRPELAAFLEYAKRTYDRVLFDCPPVMAVSEAGIVASLVEGVIVVVWAGQTSRKLAALAVQLLRERGANILGCVLNNLEFGRVGYYYYSTYYGYYDYSYRYAKKGAESPKPGPRL